MTKKIRRWSIDDFQAVREVLWKTWMDAYVSFIPEDDLKEYFDATYTIEKLNALFHDPAVNGFVAEVEGNVVGFVRTTYRKDQGRHYVSSIYILPQFQAMGFGHKLMQRAAEEAKTHNIDRVWLGVMVENRAAVTWYQKMGFEVVEETPFRMGKTTVNHYIGYVPVKAIEAREKDSASAS